MAGFSLGGGGNTRRNTQEEDQIAPENLFLYNSSTNTTPSNRGFELWQHQEIARQHHQFYSSAPTMLAFSSDDNNPHNMTGTSSGVGVHRRGSSSASGGMSCQDCGNQAKKDCTHMRCRTCCKSRGFPCSTHVKSTWVPASRRRERQQQLTGAINIGHDQQQQQQQQLQQQQQHRDILSKRPREITTRLPSTALANTGLGMEAVSFPPEVSSPAVFRCVRVSQLDQGEDEYAYQTAVNIGGHLFRGILYDQGPEQVNRGESSSMAAAAATVTAITPGITTSSGNVAGSGVMVDPSTVYATPLNAFIAGTQFFPHHDPRST